MNSKRSGDNTRFRAMAAGFAILAAFSVLAAANIDPAGASQSKRNRYIGAKACKNCHSSESSGNQYDVWSQARHAKAYETLATDKANEFATARGIEDALQADECLRCHVTGHGLDKKELKKGFDIDLGIQCESCHGPGESHMKARFAAAASGEVSDYTPPEEGEIIRAPSRDTCLACHNEESPGYKPFCFHEFVQKIRHLNPRKPRTDEELAALEACACPSDCVCFEEGKCSK